MKTYLVCYNYNTNNSKINHYFLIKMQIINDTSRSRYFNFKLNLFDEVYPPYNNFLSSRRNVLRVIKNRFKVKKSSDENSRSLARYIYITCGTIVFIWLDDNK